jgi:YD repeat-containing protein
VHDPAGISCKDVYWKEGSVPKKERTYAPAGLQRSLVDARGPRRKLHPAYALGQTRTVTKNSQGQVVSVTDPANQTTTYAYDPFGKLITTTDPVGNVVAATYDLRGRKIASSDPDLGAWTYAYDTASELVSQTDAKSQTSTFSYDILGRLTQRVEPDMTSAWVYDTAPYGIGKVTSASITAGPSAGYARQFSYDSLGRPNQVAITIDSATYTFAATYDANSRLSTVNYPSGFSLNYTYTNLGYAQQLANGSTVYWTANARDAEMHLTQQTAGNGVVTSKSFVVERGDFESAERRIWRRHFCARLSLEARRISAIEWRKMANFCRQIFWLDSANHDSCNDSRTNISCQSLDWGHP